MRNHLPVPNNAGTVNTHKIVVEADPDLKLFRAELTVQDLKDKFEAVTLTVTLQCAGNRRNDMCAVETVSGRAPWNAGGLVSGLVRFLLPLCPVVSIIAEECRGQQGGRKDR